MGNVRLLLMICRRTPYKGDLEILQKEVVAKGLESVVEVVERDVRNLQSIAGGSVDLVISNELFCELDRVGLEQALRQFYRILKKEGQMIQVELSPAAENRASETMENRQAFYGKA